ncbi:MAG TPA: hypothetical protein VM925_24190 [Labilithrix sp.]|nr:hypothetical protein [Labilithrix sp.]
MEGTARGRTKAADRVSRSSSRLVLSLLVAVSGCGLEVVTVARDRSPTEPDTPPQRATEGGAGVLDAEVVSDGGGDGVEADAGCKTVVVDDALGTIDEARWMRSMNQAGYPSVAFPAGPGRPMVSLLPSMQANRHGGLWLKDPVPLRAFDVSVDYLVTCPAKGPCGDGIGVAWMKTTNPADLESAETGPALGVPKREGGAVTVSLAYDFDNAHGAKPVTLAVHEMTAGLPGKIALSASNDSFVRQILTMSLRMRSGTIEVSIGAGTSAVGFTVNVAPADWAGYFGFVAGTSSAVDGAFVSSFHGKFHSCDP